MRVLVVNMLLLMLGGLRAQIVLKGKVKDVVSGKGVAFAAVGIHQKPLGVICNEEGVFIIKSGLTEQDDSLTVTAIGYKPRMVALTALVVDNPEGRIDLEPEAFKLPEVTVKSEKIYYKFLGTTKYSKSNCSGFVKNEDSWKGSESAILIKNEQPVLIEDFGFFVIRNTYEDSLTFRLMFYHKTADGKVGETFLQRPVIFKLKQSHGEFRMTLRDENIRVSGDFFVSLECLMDEMDISRFCYAGSYRQPSYIKASHFQRWTRVRGGGSDYNLKVSYSKE
ncbi:MAG: carboxypeptidase-like regulatory domain-containing protein [Sediminibacterium sp.]|nr:carboxypeptidase-like regulatory domain-containing protein [Sediminibacterium sp.]